MLLIISPAKTMATVGRNIRSATLPEFLDKASLIADILKTYSPDKLSRLLAISPKLAELNANRYTEWRAENHAKSGKPALLLYNGDVYQGLQAKTFSFDELAFAQKKLRIISGLYGILRPLDLILPYRLDMGTALRVGRTKDMYQFWKKEIAQHISQAMKEANTDVLVNLASEEYFRAVDQSKLKARIITPVFKDLQHGQYQIISYFAKKARGMMSRFILGQCIEYPHDIKLFGEEGYFYNDNLSDENKWVFTRG